MMGREDKSMEYTRRSYVVSSTERGRILPSRERDNRDFKYFFFYK